MPKHFLSWIAVGFLFHFCCLSPSFAVSGEIERSSRLEFIPQEFIVKFKEEESPKNLVQKVGQRAKRGATFGGLLKNIGEDLVCRLKGEGTPEEKLENLQNLETKVKTVEKKSIFSSKTGEKVLGSFGGAETLFDQYFLYKISPQVDTLTAIEEFKKYPGVEFVEPNYLMKLLVEPNDPYYQDHSMWGLEKIEMEKAWEINKGDREIIVAVIDSGVDYKHEDFQGGEIEIIRGPNYVGCGLPEDDPMDQFGHGTHIAGTIGAATNNGIGIAGINWRVKILAIKAGCQGKTISAAAGAAGIVYAADFGAKVINLSWGGGGSRTIQEAVKYAYQKGVFLVGAVGNSGGRGAICPACYDEVLGVAATTPSDQRAPFSNYGPGVEVSAPGVEIISLRSKENHMCSGAKYCYASGTSMAAPHVSGLAALIFAQNPNLSPEEVKTRIINAADSIITDRPIGPRINASRALGGAVPSPTPTTSPGPTPSPTPSAFPSPSPSPSPPPGPVKTLSLTVKLQGINSKKPDKDMALKIAPGEVNLFPRFTCDFAGNYTTTVDLTDYNLPSGFYTISVKEPHHLTKEFSVTLKPGINMIIKNNPGEELPAGDINNDDVVDEKDLQLLTKAYNPFSLVEAVEDLDEDGYVNSLDYSLLLSNINL